MKNKMIFIIVFGMVLSLFFNGCTGNVESDEDLYEIQILAADSDIYAASVPLIELQYYTNPAAAAQKEAQIGTVPVALQYETSMNNGFYHMDLYRDQTLGVRYGFDSRLQKLALIEFQQPMFVMHKPLQTESDYRDWVEACLSQFADLTSAMYRYSCQTRVLVSTESPVPSLSSDIYDSFYVPQGPGEELYSYTFQYTKYIGDIRTADGFTVYVEPSKGITLIKCDRQQFDQHDGLKVDIQKVDNTIAEKVPLAVNRDKYVLKSYQQKQEAYLDFVDGRMCLVCPIEAFFVSKTAAADEIEDPFAVLFLVCVML